MDIGSALLPMGIIPALFILYITLEGYEGRFKEHYIFLTFIGGIAMGTLIYFLEIWVLSIFNYDVFLQAVDVILITSLIFSFLESMSKLIVLNLPRFQDDEGVVLYGASLGLGFASPAGVILMRGVHSIISMHGLYASLISVSALLISCSAAMWIGLGVKIKKKARYVAIASLVGLFIWPPIFFNSSPYAAVASIAYAIFIYIYTRNSVQPYMMGRKALKEAYRKKWLRKF
ncbi:MAG: hypothetical protein DRN33_03310 [Thermoplasmata archaeon]|nr:MAG: hypothetical protein DRN33_03310 [Thermoplasmata archaeon]